MSGQALGLIQTLQNLLLLALLFLETVAMEHTAMQPLLSELMKAEELLGEGCFFLPPPCTSFHSSAEVFAFLFCV